MGQSTLQTVEKISYAFSKDVQFTVRDFALFEQEKERGSSTVFVA